MELKDVWLLDCFEFDRVVSETFGRPYSLLHSGDGEYSNGCVEFVDIPDKYGWEGEMTVDEWLALPVPADNASYEERARYETNVPRSSVLMEELVKRGVAEAGSYAIHIWW